MNPYEQGVPPDTTDLELNAVCSLLGHVNYLMVACASSSKNQSSPHLVVYAGPTTTDQLVVPWYVHGSQGMSTTAT